MSRKLNSPIQRYQSEIVIDHIASQYVLGQLSELCRRRVRSLMRSGDYPQLSKAIKNWEVKLSPLNEKIPELAPLPETWTNIQSRLSMIDDVTDESKDSVIGRWLSIAKDNWFGAVSFASCMVLIAFLLQSPTQNDPLSYVAVLQDEQNSPKLVAATYGDSRRLVLDIIDLPEIDQEESFELWVASKTDNQLRSLGEIPINTSAFERQLSDAEWRLIVDSSYLIVSVEEAGGSAIGEPSDEILSRGLCVRLSAWEESS